MWSTNLDLLPRSLSRRCPSRSLRLLSLSRSFSLSVIRRTLKSSPKKSQCKGTKWNRNNKSITLFDLSTDLERIRSRERCLLRDGEGLRSRSRERLRFLSLSLVPEDSASFFSEESAAICKKKKKKEIVNVHICIAYINILQDAIIHCTLYDSGHLKQSKWLNGNHVK